MHKMVETFEFDGEQFRTYHTHHMHMPHDTSIYV